jgi:hypothetical protein
LGGLGVGVEVAELDASGAAVSWTTRAAPLVLGEGVGVLAALPAAVRVTFDGAPLDDPVVEEGVLPGSAAGVSDEADDDEVAVVGGLLLDRNCERMLEASLGETVVVVVVLAALAVTVTVTVTALELTLVVEVEDEDDVEEEVDVEEEEEVEVEEVEDVEEELEVVVPLSEPVMPPLTPAASINPRTLLSLVQITDVPGVRISGMAKHC